MLLGKSEKRFLATEIQKPQRPILCEAQRATRISMEKLERQTSERYSLHRHTRCPRVDQLPQYLRQCTYGGGVQETQYAYTLQVDKPTRQTSSHSLGSVQSYHGSQWLSESRKDDIDVHYSLKMCGDTGLSGAGCGSSACPVLRGFGRSDLAVLPNTDPV